FEGTSASLGDIYIQQQQTDQAIALYQSATEANPTEAWPLRLLGNAYALVGDNEQALAAFKQALVLEPDNASLYTQLGNLYQWNRQQPAEALPYYRRAVALAPDQGWYYTTLAGALFALGQKTEAQKTLETALRREPNSTVVQQAVGDLMLQYESPAAAQPYYEQAIKLDPKNAYAHLGLARFYQQMGDFAKALDHLQQSINFAPNQYLQADANLEMANLYLAQNKPDAGLEQLLPTIDQIPTDSRLYAAAGNLYYQQGNIEQALSYYRRSTEIPPPIVWHYLTLGAFLLEIGQSEEGLQVLQSAVAIDPNSSAVHQRVAELAVQYGQPQLALPYLEKAINLDPNNEAAKSLLENLKTQLN
ncbi:MAG: tetratricopeptide repeat protein, partial [Anaerolineae bacterium]|nr:tetratricopeptide repeat protein [Anaerolineae bacterium]